MAKKSVVGDVNPYPGTSDKEIDFRKSLKKDINRYYSSKDKFNLETNPWESNDGWTDTGHQVRWSGADPLRDRYNLEGLMNAQFFTTKTIGSSAVSSGTSVDWAGLGKEDQELILNEMNEKKRKAWIQTSEFGEWNTSWGSDSKYGIQPTTRSTATSVSGESGRSAVRFPGGNEDELTEYIFNKYNK